MVFITVSLLGNLLQLLLCFICLHAMSPSKQSPRRHMLVSTSERKGENLSGCSARGKLYSRHKGNGGMPFFHLNLLLVLLFMASCIHLSSFPGEHWKHMSGSFLHNRDASGFRLWIDQGSGALFVLCWGGICPDPTHRLLLSPFLGNGS